MTEPSDLTETIPINEQLAIPVAELEFRFSRSSGPGGQHVQKSETRVELLFDVARSPSLTDDQRAHILHRLAGYADGQGVLRIVSSTTRSQTDNRADAMERFRVLLAGALRRRKRRVPTKPTAASREQRLAGKKARSRTKDTRRKVGRDDDA